MTFSRFDKALFDELFEIDISPAKLRRLIEKGANPNAIDPETGQTFLTEAVETLTDEEAEVLALIVELGADPQRDTEGVSPLVAAIWEQKVEMVKVLLRSGAKARAPLSDGESALDAAEEFAEHLTTEGENTETIQQIIELLRQAEA